MICSCNAVDASGPIAIGLTVSNDAVFDYAVFDYAAFD